jgi:bifunctional DNase/RNase
MPLKIRNKLFLMMSFWLLAASCCAAQSADNPSAQPDRGTKTLIRVNIHQLVVDPARRIDYQLVVDPASRQPVVTLADPEEKRALFIWIGLPEARAIYSELEGIRHQRPLTHDLLEKIILETEGGVYRVVVTHTLENIYYATVVLQKGDNLIEIDARPSDALVMALKFDAPVFVSRDLFEKMSLPLESRDEVEESYGLSLQELTPDLAQYLRLESKTGVMVSAIRKGSQAEADGLMTGDIIVEIAGQIVEDLRFLRKTFEKSKQSLKAKVFRNNRFLTLTVHPE